MLIFMTSCQGEISDLLIERNRVSDSSPVPWFMWRSDRQATGLWTLGIECQGSKQDFRPWLSAINWILVETDTNELNMREGEKRMSE